jgi:hypothetical protein
MNVKEIHFDGEGWPTHLTVDNGECIPVTNVYDEDGDELEYGDDTSYMKSIVAGPLASGEFLATEFDENDYNFIRVN